MIIRKIVIVFTLFIVAHLCAQNNSFDATLDKSFYMTGDSMNDLYVTVTVNSGVITKNTDIELVKKNNPSERISGKIYKVSGSSFNELKELKKGQEGIIFLKVNNDKGFSLGYTGDQYFIVKKGQKDSVPTVTLKNEAKAKILVDGKIWNYDYYHIYHYTKDYGVTKNPANYLIVFTKKNKRMKNSPEETLQVSLFHAPKSTKVFSKKDIDLSFMSDMFGEERAYTKTFAAVEEASATISSYSIAGAKAKISGKVSTLCKQFTCGACPKIKIEIDFSTLVAELFNN